MQGINGESLLIFPDDALLDSRSTEQLERHSKAFVGVSGMLAYWSKTNETKSKKNGTSYPNLDTANFGSYFSIFEIGKFFNHHK